MYNNAAHILYYCRGKKFKKNAELIELAEWSNIKESYIIARNKNILNVKYEKHIQNINECFFIK